MTAQPHEEDRYVSTAMLAVLYPYKAVTWRRWVQRGRIRGYKPFGRVMISLREAQALMQTTDGDREPSA